METFFYAAYVAHGVKGSLQRKRYWLEQSSDWWSLCERFRISLRDEAWRLFYETYVPTLEAWLKQPDHQLIDWYHPAYPEALKNIIDSPVLLYVRGSLSVWEKPWIGIVGSRECSREGAEMAFTLSRELAQKGWGVVSGMALGIDAAVHRGSLAVPSASVGVLATGVDRIYPAGHVGLAQSLLGSQGALISDFALGVRAKAWQFPHRNRLISGLSQGVVVVEAQKESGSLITARLAMEQGRQVFAVPGSVRNPYSAGCHMLIKDGAQLVEQADDIHGSFFWNTASQPKEIALKEPVWTDEGDQKVWSCLSEENKAFDVIAIQSGLTAEKVSSILLKMELEGNVLASAGGYRRQ